MFVASAGSRQCRLGSWLRFRPATRPRRPTWPRIPRQRRQSTTGQRFPRKPKPTGRKRWRRSKRRRRRLERGHLRFGFRRSGRQQGAGRQVRRSHLYAGPGADRCGKGEALKQYNRRSPSIKALRCPRRCRHRRLQEGREAQAFAAFERRARRRTLHRRLRQPCHDADGAQWCGQRRRPQQPAPRARDRCAVLARLQPDGALFLGRAQDNKKMLDLAGVVCRQAQLINANYARHLQHLGPDQREEGERFRRPPHVREGGPARPQELRSSHELRTDHAQLPRL